MLCYIAADKEADKVGSDKGQAIKASDGRDLQGRCGNDANRTKLQAWPTAQADRGGHVTEHRRDSLVS